jgi:hypothetical protein
VWGWGDNTYGQLGTVSTAGSTIPVQMSGLTSVAAIGTGGWHMLAVQAPDAPSLTSCSPSDKASNVPINCNISWLPVTYYNSDFQLSRDANFSALIADVSNSISNSYSPTNALSSATTYYWRVRSRAINLTSAWVTGSFTTVGATPKPTTAVTTAIITASVAPGTGSSMGAIVITAVITAVIVAALVALLFIVYIAKGKKKPGS